MFVFTGYPITFIAAISTLWISGNMIPPLLMTNVLCFNPDFIRRGPIPCDWEYADRKGTRIRVIGNSLDIGKCGVHEMGSLVISDMS